MARMELMEQRTFAILREIAAANPDELMRSRWEEKSGIGEVVEELTISKYLEDEYVSPYSKYLKDRKEGVITDKQVMNGESE